MLRLAKDGAEVVHEAASNPDGACIRGRQHCKGGEEGREEDVDGEIHHQDGDRSNNRTYKYRLHAVLVLTYMRFRVLVLDEITHGSPTHSTDRRNYSGQALQCCVFAQLKLVLDICLASRS